MILLKSEIWAKLFTRKGISINLDFFLISRSFRQSNGDACSKRMLYLYGGIINDFKAMRLCIIARTRIKIAIQYICKLVSIGDYLSSGEK